MTETAALLELPATGNSVPSAGEQAVTSANTPSEIDVIIGMSHEELL